MMSESLPEVYLARHGETEWTVTGQNTGRTDLRLTGRGEDNAWGLRGRLRGLAFDRVFVSPLQRARRTCELAGFGDRVVTIADLSEWDYGSYEGRRTDEIRRERPGWRLFRDGCPATATSSGFWLLAGWACRRRTRVTSCSVPRRSLSWATSMGWIIRPSCSGMTTGTLFPEGSARARRHRFHRRFRRPPLAFRAQARAPQSRRPDRMGGA